MLKSIRSSYVQLRSIQKGAKKFKKVEVKFSRGMESEDEKGVKNSYYDRLGYWESRHPISEDESLRHGIIIPKIPLDTIGIESQGGRRPENEDRVLVKRVTDSHVIIAVFDGHGSDLCADYCKDNLERYFVRNLQKHKMTTDNALQKAVRDLDKNFISYAKQMDEEQMQEEELTNSFDNSFEGQIKKQTRLSRPYLCTGSTLTAVVIEDGLFIHWAWVGDSRVILCRNGVAKRLTFDHSLDLHGSYHNPIRDSELKRIEEQGGVVREESNGEYRIYCNNLNINMTRALGDVAMKDYGIISEPCSMKDLPIGDHDYARITRIDHTSDAFLTIITDGISGPMSISQISKNINSRSSARESAKHLVDTALHLGSDDNCTAIVVPLGAWGKFREPSSSVSYTRNFIGRFSRY